MRHHNYDPDTDRYECPECGNWETLSGFGLVLCLPCEQAEEEAPPPRNPRLTPAQRNPSMIR